MVEEGVITSAGEDRVQIRGYIRGYFEVDRGHMRGFVGGFVRVVDRRQIRGYIKS